MRGRPVKGWGLPMLTTVLQSYVRARGEFVLSYASKFPVHFRLLRLSRTLSYAQPLSAPKTDSLSVFTLLHIVDLGV